jgi:hypothetical protein
MTNRSQDLLNPHSTRLFPAKCGANGYRINGIAERCDWVILSDHRRPKIHFHQNIKTEQPRHIFLSMRYGYRAIHYFARMVLPQINSNFILITGSEDMTLPNQCDRRKRPFNKLERSYIEEILTHPKLIHWFCENLDDDSHPLMSPIPIGFIFKSGPKAISIPDSPSLKQRPLRVLCAHRIRKGPQWEPRRQVTRLGLSDWSRWCTVIEDEISENEYMKLLREHRFVLCVEGGGVDPSPKAWHTLLNGAIPIIRSASLKRAYQELPVAFITDWQSQYISEEILQKWSDQLSPQFEDKSANGLLMKKLGIDFWWDKIKSYDESCTNRSGIKEFRYPLGYKIQDLVFRYR